MKKVYLGGIPGLPGFSEAPIEILLGYVEGSEYGNGYKELARYKYPTFEITTANRAEYPELSDALSDFGEELKGYTIEEYDDLALENFNRKLNDLDKIHRYDNLDCFLRTYASNLVFKVNDQKIKTSLISLSQGDNLKEKEAIIRQLYKLVDDYCLEKLINNKRKWGVKNGGKDD